MGEIFSFGEWVRRRRKALDLTQDALARRVSVAAITIQKIESDRRRPSRHVAELLADALAMPDAERDQFLRTARAELAPDRLAPPAEAILERGQDPYGRSVLRPDSIPPRPGNLPAHLPTLLGRAHDLETIAALLAAPDLRLLTLIGPGGIGKTSLALGVATQLADRHPDGVWFVDLAPISDPARVAPAIVQALGLPEGSQHASEDSVTWARLARWLDSRQALLVLDNLEQVVDALPPLAGLLRAATQIQVLATSRVALRLSVEREYQVAPLAIASRGASSAALHAPAVQLFISRAQAVCPSLRPTAAETETIGAICALLDGLPLAIELAAARTRIFHPAELLGRLRKDGGLTLLSGGARDLPARQQTIRATIEWSVQLLRASERLLFQRLGVLVGSWTLELAEQICGDSALLSLPGALQTLVEHSLVQQQVGQDGAIEFRMLETVRAYARELLAASGEELARRDRHLAACVALAEEAEPQLRCAAQLAWLPRLDARYDNLRAALVWGLDDGPDDPERRTRGLRLAGALWYYWYIRGRFQEIFRWLDHLAADDERLPVALRAHVLLSHRFALSETNAGTEVFDSQTSNARALALAERAADQLLLARGLLWSAEPRDWPRGRALIPTIHEPWWQIWLLRGNSDATEIELDIDRLQKILAQAYETGDSVQVSRMLSILAFAHLLAGSIAAAQHLAQEELRLVRQLRFTYGVASALFMYTRVLDAQGECSAALNSNQERGDIERMLDIPLLDTPLLPESARLMIWLGKYSHAAVLLAQDNNALVSASAVYRYSVRWTRAWLALEQGDGEKASQPLQSILIRSPRIDRFSRLQHEHVFLQDVVARWLLGTIAASQGSYTEAGDWYAQSTQQMQDFLSERTIPNVAWIQVVQLAFTGPAIVALSGLGRIAAYHPDRAWVRAWLAEMLDAIRTHAGIWETTIARAVWGRAYLGWGEYPAAAAQLANDLRFYQKAGARRAAAEALECLGMCGVAQGQPNRAARVWGAAATIRAQIGAPIWPADIPIYDQHVATARSALTPAAFDAAFAAGRALTLDQAVAEALALSERVG